MSTSDLWRNKNYLSNIDYLLDSRIAEYDISKANISTLLHVGRINKTQYNELAAMPKFEREVTIGMWMQKDPTLYKSISECIEEARHNLFDFFQLEDYEVLSIKNDSVTVIGRDPVQSISVFSDNSTVFRLDGVYTSYCKLQSIKGTAKKEIYYYYDRMSGQENISVKGISNEALQLHRGYFLDFIMALFNAAEIEGPRAPVEMLAAFNSKYINREWETGYYRRFDSISKFDLEYNISEYATFQADFVDELNKGMIDISYNESMIQRLISIFSSNYFNKVK